MRPRPHPLAALLSIALLCNTAVAEEEGPLSDRGKTALGLPLPSSGSKGISIWRVRSKTMWGFEMDFSHVSASRVSGPVRPPEVRDGVTYYPLDDRLRIGLRPTLTIKRFSPVRRTVAPFWYQTLYGNFSYLKFPQRDEPIQRGKINWSAGVGLGFGVAWFPWQRVSLSLRQGIALEFKQEDVGTAALSNSPRDEPTIVKVLDNTFSLLIPSMRLIALFHF